MQHLTRSDVALLSQLQQRRILASTDLTPAERRRADLLAEAGLIICGEHMTQDDQGQPMPLTIYRHDPGYAQRTAPSPLLCAVEAALPSFLAPLPTPFQQRAQWRVIRGTGQPSTPPANSQPSTRLALALVR